ncbi:hypothetical protein SEVIR_9G419851v4 [Setaria viridis]
MTGRWAKTRCPRKLKGVAGRARGLLARGRQLQRERNGYCSFWVPDETRRGGGLSHGHVVDAGPSCSALAEPGNMFAPALTGPGAPAVRRALEASSSLQGSRAEQSNAAMGSEPRRRRPIGL